MIHEDIAKCNGARRVYVPLVHLNPVNPARAKLLRPEVPLRDFAWSSWPAIITVELKHRGWTEESLRQRLKGDAGKVRIAESLRAATMQTVGWIAGRLHLGSRAYAHHLLWQPMVGIELPPRGYPNGRLFPSRPRFLLETAP